MFKYGPDVKVVCELVDGRKAKHLYIGEDVEDGNTQSVIYEDDPNFVDWFYPQSILSSVVLTGPPKKVLVIGLGGGMLGRMICSSFPDTEVVYVELSENVIQAAKDHFRIDEYPFSVVHADGAKYILETEDKYDWIIMDAFWTDVAPVASLTSVQFVTAAKSKLTEGGIFFLNVVGRYKYHAVVMHNVFKHLASSSSQNSDETTLFFGFNFKSSRTWLLEDLRASAKAWNEKRLPCKIDFSLMLEALLAETPCTNIRLTI